MEEHTEGLIIEALKRGDEHAYKFLYDKHYPVLCHIASQYVHDDFLAETITGDVIFHLWKVRGRISIDTSIRNYLGQYDSQKAYALFKHRVARKQNEQKRRNHMRRLWYAAASIVVLLIISSLIYIGAGYPY